MYVMHALHTQTINMLLAVFVLPPLHAGKRAIIYGNIYSYTIHRLFRWNQMEAKKPRNTLHPPFQYRGTQTNTGKLLTLIDKSSRVNFEPPLHMCNIKKASEQPANFTAHRQ